MSTFVAKIESMKKIILSMSLAAALFSCGNGNEYKVAIGDIENGIAEVQVNGTPYKVELEQKAAPTVKVSSPKPAAAPRTATGEEITDPETPGGGSDNTGGGGSDSTGGGGSDSTGEDENLYE